jgi:hypothetical protein
MPSLAEDAQRMTLLFEYGVVADDEVVAWADWFIVQMDSPPYLLLELSTTAPSKRGDILTCLHRLSVGADFWAAFRSALPRLRDYIASYPDRAEGIANQLSLTACNSPPSDVPDDLNFICHFDDAFSLAREGTYGESETVYREFVHELDRFSQVA